MAQFYGWLGEKKSARIRLAVMGMWKPFRVAMQAHTPKAAILFDKFHIVRHLGEALDTVRKTEYAWLAGRDRRYIKGQKYSLLSRRENLTLESKKALPPTSDAIRPTCSRRASANSGVTSARFGRGVSSRIGGLA
jgi:transposase